MELKKERWLVLFLLFLSLLPLSVFSKTCSELFCPSLGKTCVYSNSTSEAGCADYCKENDIVIAPVGSCSINRSYCGAGGISRDKCGVCGCPKGMKCQLDGTCLSVCEDGTLDAQCSPKKPLYCQKGILIEKSDVCGCEENKVPQPDGSCGFGGFIEETAESDFLQGSISGSFISKGSPENLAIEGTAFASSFYNVLDWWYIPDSGMANDGSYYGDWVSELSSALFQKDQHIGIEWSEEKTFNEIIFTQSFFLAKNYKIQQFKNGNWIDVTKVQFLQSYPDDFVELAENRQIAEKVKFPPVTASKVRIVFPECYFACRISEIEIYNSEIDSLKLNVQRGFISGEYISQAYDTRTTQSNITYSKLFMKSSRGTIKKSKSVNIAPLAKVNVSSSYTAPSLDNGSNLIDERLTEYVPELKYSPVTGWASNITINQWVSLRFPEKKRIDKIVFNQIRRYIKSYEIRIWDGIKWKAIVGKTSLPYYPKDFAADDLVGNYLGEVEVNFDGVTTEGIQLYMPECSENGTCYLSEIKVYEEADNSKPRNIALEGTAIASSTYPGVEWVSKDYVNDGDIIVFPYDPGNVWIPDDGDDTTGWIGIEWPTPRTISKVNFIQARPMVFCHQYYHLQYWDGTGWKDINRAFNKGTPDDFGLPCVPDSYWQIGVWLSEELFNPVTTTKIRIIPEPRWYQWPYIKEIQAYEAIG